MTSEFKNLKFRKLRITDYNSFKKLFYSCFKKKISFHFYKWRYFSDEFSFCYGAFKNSKLIANVGMISIQIDKNLNNIIYSRHSSMVLENFRGFGIFSKLSMLVKNKFLKKIPFVLMWPNNNNFSNFGIKEKNILKKKYYLYKTFKKSNFKSIIKSYPITDLIKYKKFITNEKSIYLKNFQYYKKRYISYKKNEYFLNEFKIKNLKSFFIIKYNKDLTGFNHVILDHFGSKKIYHKHLFYLIKNVDKLIFLSKTRLNNPEYKLINLVNVKIGFLQKSHIQKKRNFLKNKNFYLGDTDIFITI